MTSNFTKWLAVLSVVVGLTGCSGGGGGSTTASAGVGSGGTGMAAGTVTGFGSVIVDGVRYPDTAASYDVTGDASGAVSVSRTKVKIGQQAEVETDASGNATAVHIYPELIGVVSAISGSTITVAGVRVVVNASDASLPITVYDGYAQFSDIKVNDRVEVHGLPKTNSTGAYVAATRIELKPGVCAGGCPVRVTGTLSQLDTGARTFALSGLSVSYGDSTIITPARATLADGERVSVFSRTPLSGASLTATAIKIRKPTTAISDLRVSGAISSYTSNASFTVAGISVNAGSATFTPTSLALANDLNVTVRGSFDPATNQLVATSVSQYDSHAIRAELHGTVTNFVSVANFQVRGVTVDASAATFTGGTAANLQDNAFVEIHGTVSNNVVRATTVAFEDEANDSVADLRGVISGYTSSSQPFSITLDNRGTSVQAVLAASPFYVNGTSADLANGKYVTVNAARVNGQWVVNTVIFMLGAHSSGDGHDAGSSSGAKEFRGIASNVDQTAGTLTLNGITVNFGAATVSGSGTLVNGARIEVLGTLSGTTLTASRIEIDD